MAVAYSKLPELLPVAGVRLASVAAGIRYQGRDDLVVIELDPRAACAAVFTRNAFCAAPVTVARDHLRRGAPRFLLINSGNANAGTGQRGVDDALQSCRMLADAGRVTADRVLPFSTGVIGEYLPVERMQAPIDRAMGLLDENGWSGAAAAIMTTDTVPKGVSRTLELGGRTITLTGICKGAGMIRPDMATMLAYIATDARLSSPDLQACLNRVVDTSFNRITVDGDTSTNDACVLVATGCSDTPPLESGSEDYARFCAAVEEVSVELAQLIIRDAEGGSKFVTIDVEQGADSGECLQVAYTVAHSPLVKTALFASDPNWGRILAAVGRAGLENLDVSAVQIYLGDTCIVRNGGVDADYTEAQGQGVMSEPEIGMRILLGRGQAHERVWTSDLSQDYVRINAEYRT